MNLRKGMWRVALLLGIAGAAWGGYRCYVKLQSMLPATLNNHRFKKDANAESVQQTIRAAKAHDQKPTIGFIPDAPAQPAKPEVDWSKAQPISPPNPQAKAPQIDPRTGERTSATEWDTHGNPFTQNAQAKTPQLDEWEAGITASHAILTPLGTKCHAILMTPAEQARWNDSGMTESPLLVCWDKNYTVVSFEEQGALPFELEPAPSAWEYCWCAFLPILGFFIPWTGVRLIAWVLAGFAARPTA